MTENVFGPLPLPSSVLVPMCFCGDPCKVANSDEEDTYRQRYWMCSNFAFEPTLRQRRINKLVRNWCCVIIILCQMKSYMIYLFCNKCICCRPLHRSVILSSRSTLRSSLKTRNECRNCCGGRQRTRRWWRKDAERRLQKKSTRKRRRVVAYREEKEKKLERARRAKIAMEENPDALRKGKWPHCTQ